MDKLTGEHNPNTEINNYPEVLSYLSDKHETLKNDYRTPDNEYSESCSIITCDVAEILINKGANPEIGSITGEVLDSIGNRSSLVPRTYQGRIRWGGHMICVNEGIAYDPMIEKPIKLEEYLKTVFESEVIYTTRVPSDEVQEFIDRGK